MDLDVLYRVRMFRMNLDLQLWLQLQEIHVIKQGSTVDRSDEMDN